MHAKTRLLLDTAANSTGIDPDATAAAFETFMGQLYAATADAQALRMAHVGVMTSEPDPNVRGRVAEIDQKAGALIREAGKLMEQVARVQDILREFKQSAPRIKTDTEEMG